jgi:hypothetical protein
VERPTVGIIVEQNMSISMDIVHLENKGKS